MGERVVSIRDLRNHGGEIVERAAGGTRITITRSGAPVAELRALPAPQLTSAQLLARWAQLPSVDAGAWRRDLDGVIDPSL